MRETYNRIEIELIVFQTEDIILTSNKENELPDAGVNG